MRHSFGAYLRMRGARRADIADLMGHRDPRTTDIYTRVLADHLRAAVNRLEKVIPETVPPKRATQAILRGGRIPKALKCKELNEVEDECGGAPSLERTCLCPIFLLNGEKQGILSI